MADSKPGNKSGHDSVPENKERRAERPGRRKLLKALMGAGAVTTGGAFLPDKWQRPVVDMVFLPAHAGSSDDDDDDEDTGT